MGVWSVLKGAVTGRAAAVPSALLAAYPELGTIRWRRGGLPPRVGGWFLGHRTVAGITIGRTVWLAPDAPWNPGLLLHELRHAEQFGADRLFPLRYVWASLTRGYHRNPYEQDAVAFAGQRLRDGAYARMDPESPQQDGTSWSSTLPRRS